MIKFTLILWVCSFLQGTACLAPIQVPGMYDTWYECSRAAHQESLSIMSKLGFREVNKHKLGTKYYCKKVKVY